MTAPGNEPHGCDYVTGSSATPHREIRRRGEKRDDGRYRVLCGNRAPYLIRDVGCEADDGCADMRACSRDLAYLVDAYADLGKRVTVERVL